MFYEMYLFWITFGLGKYNRTQRSLDNEGILASITIISEFLKFFIATRIMLSIRISASFLDYKLHLERFSFTWLYIYTEWWVKTARTT